jgi:hypothetical protein
MNLKIGQEINDLTMLQTGMLIDFEQKVLPNSYDEHYRWQKISNAVVSVDGKKYFASFDKGTAGAGDYSSLISQSRMGRKYSWFLNFDKFYGAHEPCSRNIIFVGWETGYEPKNIQPIKEKEPENRINLATVDQFHSYCPIRICPVCHKCNLEINSHNIVFKEDNSNGFNIKLPCSCHNCGITFYHVYKSIGYEIPALNKTCVNN